VLVGALAALVVFAALAAVGVEVRAGDGAVRITLGRPAAVEPERDPVAEMRAQLEEQDIRQARRFEALAQAIDENLASERAGSFARDQALLDRLTRPVVVASRPRRP